MTSQTVVQCRSSEASRALVLRVVNHHGPALKRYIRTQTRDAAEIDDVMQDVFVRVLQNGEAVESSASQRAYLFSIARNLVRDRGRSNGARSRAMADLRTVVEIGEQCRERHAAPEQERTVRVRQGNEALSRAMRRLKAQHREIFLLSKVEGMRNNEIADRLSVSLRSVERHVSEVSHYIRETLAAYI